MSVCLYDVCSVIVDVCDRLLPVLVPISDRRDTAGRRQQGRTETRLVGRLLLSMLLSGITAPSCSGVTRRGWGRTVPGVTHPSDATAALH